jgi:hypothetical protein
MPLDEHFRAMPRYHFHVKNDINAVDEHGEDLENLAVAHQRAVYYARDLASAAVRNGALDLRHRIDIADGTGAVLMGVTFADAIHVTN